MVLRGRSSSRPSRSRGGGRSSFPRVSRGRSSHRGSGRHYGQESELMSKLSRIGGCDTEMAMEIVNAVLSTKGGSDEYGQASKSRRTERGRGSSSYRGGGRGGSNVRRVIRPYREDEEAEGRKRRRSEDNQDEDIVPGENSDGEVAVPDKPAFEIPIEALYCKICNLTSFKSKKAYLEHRDSKTHTELNSLYQHRNTSVLRLIRGHAKVQSSRKDFLEACRICHGTYEGSYQDHKSTLEHEVVENFLKWRCCGKFFTSRQEYDDHTLTPFHLVNKYEELKEWKRTESEMELEKNGSDAFENLKANSEIVDEAINSFNVLKKDLLEKSGEDPEDVTASLPEYDPEKPLGLKFLNAEKVFRCKACVVEIAGNCVDDIKSHLQSPDHYFEVLRQTEHLRKPKKSKSKEKSKSDETDQDKTTENEEEEKGDRELKEENTEDEEEEELTVKEEDEQRDYDGEGEEEEYEACEEDEEMGEHVEEEEEQVEHDEQE